MEHEHSAGREPVLGCVVDRGLVKTVLDIYSVGPGLDKEPRALLGPLAAGLTEAAAA
jgi:hypothetical protein